MLKTVTLTWHTLKPIRMDWFLQKILSGLSKILTCVSSSMMPRCSETCSLRNSTSCSSWAWLRSVRELGRFSWGWMDCCCEGGREEAAFSFWGRETEREAKLWPHGEWFNASPQIASRGPASFFDHNLRDTQSTVTQSLFLYRLKHICYLKYLLFSSSIWTLDASLTREKKKTTESRSSKTFTGCISPSQRCLGSGSSVSPPCVAAFEEGRHSSWTAACSSQTWASSGSRLLAYASTGQRKETGRGNNVVLSLVVTQNFQFEQERQDRGWTA